MTCDNIYYGVHDYTCVQCLKHYCYCCTEDVDERVLHNCDQCERDYCRECVKVGRCHNCIKNICEYCSKYGYECDECNDIVCTGCAATFPPTVCVFCDVVYCEDCNADWKKVRLCDGCGKSCCNSCRLSICKGEGSDSCAECIKLLPKEGLLELIEQSSKLKQEVEDLKNEVSELKNEVTDLNDVNMELRDVNKELQDEIKELKNK